MRDRRGVLQHGGRRRTFLVVRPGEPEAPGPLLVVLHGSNQRGATQRRFSGRTFDALAMRTGGTVVYPDAYRLRWNDARVGLRSASRKAGIDDVGFVHALVERAVAAREADPRRVFVVGHSNGGQLAMRIAAEAPEGIAGFAVIAASRPVDEEFLALDAPARPVPMLFVRGTADPIAPHAGGEVRLLGRPQGRTLSAVETARYFAGRNGIEAEPVETVGRGMRRLDFAEPPHPPVRLISVEGAGHVVPNRKTRPPFVGRSVATVDTGEEVGAFFGLDG